MGFFRKNDQGESRAVNPVAVLGLRVIAAGYVLYMQCRAIVDYIKGESDISVWFLISSAVVLGGGALFILISSFLSWRKEKKRLAEEKLLEDEPQKTEE